MTPRLRNATHHDLEVLRTILETSGLSAHGILEPNTTYWLAGITDAAVGCIGLEWESVKNAQFKPEPPGTSDFDSPRVTLNDSFKLDNPKTSFAICSDAARIPLVIPSALDNVPAKASAVTESDSKVTSNSGSDFTSLNNEVAARVLPSKSTSAFSNISSSFISIVYSFMIEVFWRLKVA